MNITDRYTAATVERKLLYFLLSAFLFHSIVLTVSVSQNAVKYVEVAFGTSTYFGDIGICGFIPQSDWQFDFDDIADEAMKFSFLKT